MGYLIEPSLIILAKKYVEFVMQDFLNVRQIVEKKSCGNSINNNFKIDYNNNL